MGKKTGIFRYNEKLSPFYAAVLTALIYLIITLLSGIAGFGNRTILSGDLFSQYVDFIRLFLDTIKGNGNFYYSFSLFLGSPSVSTYAYYCLSPFNLLYLIPGISVSCMTLIIIMLKLSLSASCFCYFQKKVFDRTGLFPILFGVCYSLGSFAVTMQIHIMWLDSLYILPILLLLIYRFVKGGSFLPLVAAYACLFLTNFYMGYIFGIFSGSCFLVLLILDTDSISKQALMFILKRSLGFIAAVILAAGCCAAVLLPAAYELFAQRSEGGSSFSLVNVTLLDVLNNLFPGEMQSMGSPIPLIYCGLPALLIIPVYILSDKIKLKEKLCILFMFLFYIAGSQFLPVYKFLHAMEAPNWYAHRYAPCVVFLLLCLASRAVTEIKTFQIKTLIIYAVSLLLFYAAMIPFQALLYSGYATNSHGFFILIAVFMAVYILLLYLYRSGKLSRYLPAALCLALAIELAVNGYTCMSRNSFGYESEEKLSAWENSQKSIIPMLQEADRDFYRIRVNDDFCFNSPSYFGYAGINSFNSTDNVKLRHTLSSLGIGTSFACIYDQGYTDITDMLLGVKYTLDLDTARLSGSSMALPAGFMCSPALLDYTSASSVFENQQNLINCMTNGNYAFFTPVNDYDIDKRNMEIMSFDDCILFEHLSDNVINGKINFLFNNLDNARILGYFTPMSEPVINRTAPTIDQARKGFYKAPSLSDGTIIESQLTPDGKPVITLNFSSAGSYDYAIGGAEFCLYDNSQLADAARQLAAHPFTLTSWSDGMLSGTVESTADHPILFTSIPYAKGWEAYIDDIPVSAGVTVDGTFLSLYVDPGVHNIRFEYNHPYGSFSVIISCIAICLFLLLLVIKKGRSAGQKTINAAPEQEVSDEI